MKRSPEPLIFELSAPGRRGVALPVSDVPAGPPLPHDLVRDDLPLPELSELDVVRHFTRLSQFNHSVDTGIYPLGSCSMKYSPKVSERLARLDGFANLHPLQPEETVQGALAVMYELQRYLAEIVGMDAVTLEPAAGAHGELTGMLMVRAYHNARGDAERATVLVPDSAHGTNPATATMCGFRTQVVRSAANGSLDMGDFRQHLNPQVAALMLTNPNTLGLFDENILEIARALHEHGALLYGDGANLNALLGKAKPGELGFDVMHLNLHKTFATPHGGGGPGSGPVAVRDCLTPFLPIPIVAQRDEGTLYFDEQRPRSIGRVRSFASHFGVVLRAYIYIRMLGPDGLREVSENAVLAANYMLERLKPYYDVPYRRACMHELVLSARSQKRLGVRALDIAKRLMDYGFHSPTIYFPLLVDEALMIEPTETENIETLDAYISALAAIAEEARTNPEMARTAPHNTPVGRLDEVAAVRSPNLRWRPPQHQDA